MQASIFMQEIIIPPIGCQVKELLRVNFGENCVISRGFSDASGPRSFDLNPCNFRFCGFQVHDVYGAEIVTLPEMKASIPCHVAKISREFFRAAIYPAIMCFQHVIDVNGAHFEHIL